MKFELPTDIISVYKPKRNMKTFIKLQPNIIKYFDWKPHNQITLTEVQDILSAQFGMEKTEVDRYTREAIRSTMRQHPGMNYVCSYTFADIANLKKWMLDIEIENYEYMVTLQSDTIQKMKAQKNTGSDDILENKKHVYQIERHKLIHLYSRDGVNFDDIETRGMVPLVVKFTLFHLLGKAPIPEETYSEWPMYLQFLIDMGYVEYKEPNTDKI